MSKTLTSYFLFLFMVISYSTVSTAHHSFSAFDIERKVERTGVLIDYRYGQPHITMEILVPVSDHQYEHWHIESLVPGRWERMNLDRDFVSVGDAVTIIGWPAKDGSTEMMLSGLRTYNGELIARDEINQ